MQLLQKDKILVLFCFLLVFSSCKRNYTCVCVYSGFENGSYFYGKRYYNIPNSTKNDAKDECKTYYLYPLEEKYYPVECILERNHKEYNPLSHII